MESINTTTVVVQALTDSAVQLIQTHDTVFVFLALFGAAALIKAVFDTGAKAFSVIVMLCFVTPFLLITTVLDLHKHPERKSEIYDIVAFLKTNPHRLYAIIIWIVIIVVLLCAYVYIKFGWIQTPELVIEI